MTLREALISATRALESQGLEDANLEARLLLGHALGLGRVDLYLQLDEPLTPQGELALKRLLERRLRGEPASYILGRKEFFGLEFHVDPRVLIPRLETETLVEAALDRLGSWPGEKTAVDVGTGCGAIAVSLAHRLPDLEVYATDISAAALEVAAGNARRHGVAGRVHLLLGDMLEPLPKAVALIAANLPYIADLEYFALPQDIIEHEPPVALRGGPDGLDPLRRLLAQSPAKLIPGGSLLAEIGHGQGELAMALAREAFPQGEARLLPDLAGVPRVLRILTG